MNPIQGSTHELMVHETKGHAGAQEGMYMVSWGRSHVARLSLRCISSRGRVGTFNVHGVMGKTTSCKAVSAVRQLEGAPGMNYHGRRVFLSNPSAESVVFS